MSNQSKNPEKEVVFVLPAQSTDPDESGPSYVAFRASGAFVERLQALDALCREQGLAEVRVHSHPEQWGPASIGNEIGASCKLVVGGGDFYYSALPMYGDHDFEMKSMKVAALAEAYRTAEHGGLVCANECRTDYVSGLTEALLPSESDDGDSPEAERHRG